MQHWDVELAKTLTTSVNGVYAENAEEAVRRALELANWDLANCEASQYAEPSMPEKDNDDDDDENGGYPSGDDGGEGSPVDDDDGDTRPRMPVNRIKPSDN